MIKLGYVATGVPGAADTTLLALAERLEARGLRLAGTVHISTQQENGGRCDMNVRVLGGGPVIRISQSLGPAARGCRLDPSALEQAVVDVAVRLDARVDLVLINKFGHHEASGRGFRTLIADALIMGVPVLTAVSDLNREAFLAFADGYAERLRADVVVLENWLDCPLRSYQTSSCHTIEISPQ